MGYYVSGYLEFKNKLIIVVDVILDFVYINGDMFEVRLLLMV